MTKVTMLLSQYGCMVEVHVHVYTIDYHSIILTVKLHKYLML